jgi:hypothetical protein
MAIWQNWSLPMPSRSATAAVTSAGFTMGARPSGNSKLAVAASVTVPVPRFFSRSRGSVRATV